MSSVRLIAAMCLAEMLSMLGTFAFPALLPRFFAEWPITHTEAGWINGIYFAGYMLAVPVLGSLTDRMDARRIYLAAAGAGALASLGFALLASGFWSALVLRALAGVGLAGTFIPGLKALVDRLGGHAQARAIAFYTATFSLGTSLSFFVIGQVEQHLDWRVAFLVAAGGSVLALGLAARVLAPRPPPGGRAHAHLLDFRPVLRNRAAMAYVVAYAAHMWELFGMRSWLVAFLAFSLSLQPAGAAYWHPTTIAALTGLVAMAASVAGNELAVRFGRVRVLTIIMSASGLSALAIGFGAALPYPVLSLLCLLYVVLVQGDSAALHNGAVQSAEPERRGATMAVQSLVGFTSAFLGPLAVGVVLDATGGGASVGSWVGAFAAMGLGVLLGPLVLVRLARGPRAPASA